MRESVPALQFYLPKTVEVELADKTFKFLMPEELRNDLGLHSLHI